MTTESKQKPAKVHDTDDILRVIGKAVFDKQATHIRMVDLTELVSYADAVVIVSGQNDRQVLAIVDNVEAELRKELGMKPKGIEGRNTAAWVCMDYGDVIIHVFYAPARDYYDLDSLWPDGKERSAEFLDELEAGVE